MTDATATGQRVLDGLAKGRRSANQQRHDEAEPLRRAVLALARDDERRGRPARGRASRILDQLHGFDVTLRTVQRYLLNATGQSSVSRSVCDDQRQVTQDASE